MTKIAINGFGRIGRLLFKKLFFEEGIEIVAINDLGDADNLAYLLRYDTVYGVTHGKFKAEIRTSKENKKHFVVKEKEIPLFQEKDPSQLPWKELGVDIVIESTGVFESFEKAKVHLDAGARRVVITAPAKDEDGEGRTVLVGINNQDLKMCKISSNGSCTTNAVAPVVQILDEIIGVEKAILSTVHAYTSTQSIVDGPVPPAGGRGDFRRGRAAAQNIVPSTTGAAIAVGRVVSNMKGNFDGIAMRVPVPTGSIADITFITKRNTSVEEVNDILRKASGEERWAGIVKVTEDQLVSSDIIGEPYGAIVDLSFTKVVGGNLVKVLSWYDNEAGYVATLVRHVMSASKYIDSE